MDTYLLALGWWNLIGALGMPVLLNERWGQKVLVEWGRIFKTDYKITTYGKLWLVWAAGLNIFFAIIHLLSVYKQLDVLKFFLIWFDVTAYCLFVAWGLWALVKSYCDKGIYIVFLYLVFG